MAGGVEGGGSTAPLTQPVILTVTSPAPTGGFAGLDASIRKLQEVRRDVGLTINSFRELQRRAEAQFKGQNVSFTGSFNLNTAGIQAAIEKGMANAFAGMGRTPLPSVQSGAGIVTGSGLTTKERITYKLDPQGKIVGKAESRTSTSEWEPGVKWTEQSIRKRAGENPVPDTGIMTIDPAAAKKAEDANRQSLLTQKRQEDQLNDEHEAESLAREARLAKEKDDIRRAAEKQEETRTQNRLREQQVAADTEAARYETALRRMAVIQKKQDIEARKQLEGRMAFEADLRFRQANIAMGLTPEGKTPRGPRGPGPNDPGRPNTRDMLTNVQHITQWAAGAAVLYGTLGLVRFSMDSLIKTGLQTARLEQVFRGIGGSAADVRDDVLGLASAYGRSSEEAMQAAVSWARQGLTRVEINKAVRTSIMAANVAEISSAEATQHLQALMISYGLSVDQLATKLGELNQITNIYPVTANDMLIGLSRTAVVAKEAGLPLEELMGILGATIGATRQSGANIGNAVKSIITGIGNPAIQQLLRERGVEVTAGGGDQMKSMTQIVSELYLAYQKLTEAEQKELTYRIAGKTQANRLQAMLDSYVQSQVLAINAQLNLNSAEEENKKIVATLSAQLRGLVTEWERFVSIQGNRGPTMILSDLSAGLRTALSMLNSRGVSWLTTGFLSLLTAFGARIALTGIQMNAAAKSTGFIANSFQALRRAAVGLGDLTTKGIESFATRAERKFMRSPNRLTDIYAGGQVVIAGAATELDKAGRRMMTMGLDGKLGGLGRGFRDLNMATRGFYLTLGAGARVAAGAIAFFGELALPLLALYGIMKGLTWIWEKLGGSSTSSEKRMAGFTAELEKANAKASAFRQTQKLYETATKALTEPGIKPAERERWIEGINEINPAVATKLRQARTPGEITNVLTSAGGEASRARQLATQEAFIKRQQALHEAQAELDRLKGSPLHNREAIANQEKTVQQLRGEFVSAVLEVSDAEDRWLENDLKHQTNLEKQKLLLESISQIYANMAAATPMGKAQNTLEGLKEQELAVKEEITRITTAQRTAARNETAERERQKYIDEQIDAKQKELASLGTNPYRFGPQQNTSQQDRLLAEIETLEKSKKLPTVGDLNESRLRGEKEAADKRLLELRAQIAAMQNPALRASQWREYSGDIATRFANAELDSRTFGMDRTQELLNRRKGAQDLIYRSQAALNDEYSNEATKLAAITQLKAQSAALTQTDYDLHVRGVEISKQENQLVMEKNKEIRKGLMMGGPGDILQMMAGSRLAKRGAGEWWAASPETRRTAGLFNPLAYTPEGREFGAERARLAAAGYSGMNLGPDAVAAQVKAAQDNEDIVAKAAMILETNKAATALSGLEFAAKSLQGMFWRLMAGAPVDTGANQPAGLPVGAMPGM